MEHFFEVTLPKAGVCEQDRTLLKAALESHEAYRDHAGEGADQTWLARLRKSGILVFELLEDSPRPKSFFFRNLMIDICHCMIDCVNFQYLWLNKATFQLLEQALVYNQSHDNTLRQCSKQGGAPEAALEHTAVAEIWQKVEAQLANEEAERKALLNADEPEKEAEETDEATLLQKGPNTFTRNSAMYWKSVAFQTVRTYVQLQIEAKTSNGISQTISQCALKNVHGTPGESSVIVFCDIDSLGESMGPSCQPLLRKQFQPDPTLLRKLVQCTMLGRGSQKETEEGETTKVIPGDLVILHCGFDRPQSKKECKGLFRLSTAGKGQKQDTEVKETIIGFKDESIRMRKKRVKGGYSSHTTMLIASSDSLSQAVPDKNYEHHPGSCSSDMFGLVHAVAVEDLWHATRTFGRRFSKPAVFTFFP